MISALILTVAMTGQSITPDYNPYVWSSPIMQYSMGMDPYANGYSPVLGYNPIYERPYIGANGYNGSVLIFQPGQLPIGGYMSGNHLYGGGRVRYPSRHRYGIRY